MKKIIALLLALLTLLSLCACNSDGKEEKSDNEKVNSENTQAQTDSNVIIDTPAPDEENEPEIDSMVQTPPQNDYGNDKVQKIGSMERSSFAYEEYTTRMHGITSLDGKFDSGAIYYDVTVSSDDYYYARTQKYDTPQNLNSINSINLVDSHGRTILQGYMSYEKLSDRFIAAAKAIEVVEGNGEYDYFLSGAWFALSASEGDIKYNADFYIFDLETNSFITSLKYDDSPSSGNFYGDFITYKDASGSSKILNANGYTVPDGAVLLYDTNDAYYKTETNVTGTVYDSQNNVLFTYNKETDYVPIGFTNGYFKARKQNESSLVLLDKTGKVVSAEFSVSSGASIINFNVYGSVILFRTTVSSKDQIYNFSGDIIAESANVLSCHDQNNFDKPLYYSFHSTKGDLIIVSTAGEILFEVHGDTSYDTATENCAYKESGENYYYYNLKDNSFNILAKQYANGAPYLVEVKVSDGVYNIVDSSTGETIIKGYSDYSYKTDGADIYVYAKYNGNTDIYLVRF